jgi:hypothetical protein
VPADADTLYPQTRVFLSAKAAQVDVAALKLTIVATGEVVADVGDLGGPDLPRDWNAAGFDGATAKAALVAGDAPEGRGYVRLDVAGSVVTCDIVTPSEYFRAAGEPTDTWVDAYAGFEHRYPMGLLAGDHLRADRRAEDLILALSRADAMGLLKTRPDLPALWRLLLMGHHHDVWVCAPVGAFGIWSHGYQRYVDLTMACAEEIDERAAPALRQLSALPAAAKEMTVVSLSPMARREVTSFRWIAPQGLCRTPIVVDDADRPVPAQLAVTSKHPDGSAREVTGSLLADVPATGWRTYALQESKGRVQPALDAATAGMYDKDAALGNGILSVGVSPDGVRVMGAHNPIMIQPAHLAGVFSDGPQVSHFTKITARNDGLDAVAEAEGSIGTVPISLRVTLAPYAKTATLDLTCDFGAGTIVGEGPEELPLFAPWSHEDRKLRWVFPLVMDKPEFLVHGVFELRKPSRLTWPITGMALAQERTLYSTDGLAVYPDRTTGGVFRTDPASLEVVLAYGGKFIYAPGESQPLTGKHTYRLVVYPYGGTPEDADVVPRACGSTDALVWRPGRAFPTLAGSLVNIAPAGAAVVTDCHRDGADLVFRLWRPYESEEQVKVTVARAKSLYVADLSGRASGRLASGPTATLALRPAQIVTLRAR